MDRRLVMGNILMIVGCVVCAIAGGLIGLKILLYATVAFIAGFLAVSATKGHFDSLTSDISKLTSKGNAEALSLIILGFTPALTTGYVGHMVISWLIDLDDHPVAAAVLGAGYAVTVFLIVVYILGR